MQPNFRNPGYSNNGKAWFSRPQADHQQRPRPYLNQSTVLYVPNRPYTSCPPNRLYGTNAPRRGGTSLPGHVNNTGNIYAQKPGEHRAHCPTQYRNTDQVHQADVEEQFHDTEQPEYGLDDCA